MNNYPSWWNERVTIYNKYVDSQTDFVSWSRHVVDGCFWKYSGDKAIIGNTVLETNSITCRIRKDDNYLPKAEWVELPVDTRGAYFTLGVGDLIFKGEVADEIDEYTKGKRASDIVAKYKDLQGCIEIQYVIDNTGGGRGQEHYHVRGI